MTHAPIVRDMDRITRNKEWSKAFTQAFGKDDYDQIRAWLKYIARPVSEKGDVLDDVMNKMRHLSTIYMLGLNPNTFIRQFSGYFQAGKDLGASWIFKGIGRAMLNPMALVRHVNTQSAYLADRDKNFLREMRKETLLAMEGVTLGGHTFSKAQVEEVAMSLVTLGNRLTTYPIWQGAFMRASESLGMGHAEAVAYADSIVQKTQASATAADLNVWQREGGKGIKRFFSMFMGESFRKGSRMRYWWRAWQRGKISLGDYAGHVACETVGTAALYLVLRSLLTDSEPKKKTWLKPYGEKLPGLFHF